MKWNDTFTLQCLILIQFSSVQLLSRVRLFATPWTAACQASLSITNSWSTPKPMSIVSVMPSNHIIYCYPFLLLPSIFPSIRVFSNESALCLRWPKYWSFRGVKPLCTHFRSVCHQPSFLLKRHFMLSCNMLVQRVKLNSESSSCECKYFC